MEDDQPIIGHRRGPCWIAVGHGLHRPASTQPMARSLPAGVVDTALFAADATAWQLLLPGSACFTHLTAAILRDWWVPPLLEDLPFFVAQHKSNWPAERPQLRVTRHSVTPPSEQIHGLRIASVTEALLACARDLGLIDLVVMVDCVLHTGAATREEIEIAASGRRRGTPRLRRALALADGRSESAWETLLRLLHVVCGVAVEPQFELNDAAGRFVARGDLRLVGTQTLHEYDGGEHLKRSRQRQDLERGRRLGHEDWVRRGYTSEDVLHQAVGILRDADASIGREHDPERVRAWHALLRESLFTPAGTERFRRRIGLPPSVDGVAG